MREACCASSCPYLHTHMHCSAELRGSYMPWSAARFIPIPWVQHAGLRVEVDAGAHVHCGAKVNQLHLRACMCGTGKQNFSTCCAS